MRQNNKNKRNYIIIGLCSILLIMTVGYAAFSQMLQINGTSNITSNWNIEITGIRAVNDSSVTGNSAYDIDEPAVGSDKLSDTFHTGLKSPRDARIYEIEITNKGSLDAEVTSVFTNTLSDSVHFSYDGVGPLGGSGTDVLTNAGVYNTNLLSEEESFSLPATTNNVRYIYMTVKYRESVASQPNNLSATINLKLNAVQSNGTVTPDGTGVEIVRAAGIDFPVVTTGDGLYYDSNTAEYYYRGANPDNYIEFSGDVWRIMSISPNGNLKIIKDDRIDLTGYSGVNSEDNYKGRFDASGATGRRTSGYCSKGDALNYGCNAWARVEKYVNGRYNGTVTADSELNTFLNSTYKTYLSDLNYIQTEMTWNVGHAGENNDTLTVSQLENIEKTYTWNGDIALPTKSEYIRAQGSSNCFNASTLISNRQNNECKGTNYLFKTYHYWLLSPNYDATSYQLNFRSGGFLNQNSPYSQNVSVRPALYLKSNITLTGNGTNDENIYRIS